MSDRSALNIAKEFRESWQKRVKNIEDSPISPREASSLKSLFRQEESLMVSSFTKEERTSEVLREIKATESDVQTALAKSISLYELSHKTFLERFFEALGGFIRRK